MKPATSYSMLVYVVLVVSLEVEQSESPDGVPPPGVDASKSLCRRVRPTTNAADDGIAQLEKAIQDLGSCIPGSPFDFQNDAPPLEALPFRRSLRFVSAPLALCQP